MYAPGEVIRHAGLRVRRTKNAANLEPLIGCMHPLFAMGLGAFSAMLVVVPIAFCIS